MKDGQTNQPTPAAPQGDRPTIGLVVESFQDLRHLAAWPGVGDLAQERDVDLFCFVAGDHRGGAANVLHDLVSKDVVDGLISFHWWDNRQQFESVYDRWRPLPVVNILRAYEGHSGVMVDGYQAMRDMMRHLVQVHGYRRIAHARGPAGYPAADARYRAYVDALEEYGLTPDPDLVYAQCVAEEPSFGAKAVHIWLDERGFRPRMDVEAVVAFNDDIARQVLSELHRRGVQVPAEMAVVGFDDDAEAEITAPPLTTIALPFREIGRRAAQAVLDRIAGEQTPEQIVVPTRLVARQSCGCMPPTVTQVAVGPVTKASESLEIALLARRTEILAEAAQALADQGPVSEWVGRLWDSFAAELRGQASGIFVRELDDILRQVYLADGDIAAWHSVISTLRRRTLPYVDGEALLRAEDLWQQARVIIGDTAQRAEMQHALQAEQQAQTLREISQSLITTFDVGELMDVLLERLPRLDIPSCYLALYEDPHRPAEWSRLILAYNEQGRVELEPEGRRFPSRRLIPEGLLSPKRRYSFVVEALYFQDRQFGFVLFEAGPQDGKIYETLRDHISSALQGALLAQEGERAQAALEKAYAEVEKQVEERTAELQREIAGRRLAQEALAHEQYLMRSLMENIFDRIYFKDTDSRFIRINQALAAQFGLSNPAEAAGKTDFDFFSEEHARQAYADEQQAIGTGQPIVGAEEKETWPDGRETWASTTKLPLRDEDGRIVGTFGISRDITERKRLEHTLRLTQFCLDRAPVGIMRTGPDARILSANDEVCRNLGYTPEELCTLHIFDIDPTFPLERWQQHRNDLRARGSDTFETVHRRKDGTTFPVEITNSYLEFQGSGFAISFVRDISKRKQAEAQVERNLRETDLRFEVSQALAGAETEDQVLDALIQHAGFYPQAQVAIFTFDMTASEPTFVTRRSDSFESGLPSLSAYLRLPASRHPLLHRYLSANHPFVLDNVLSEDAMVDPSVREEFRQLGISSFAAIPLTAGNEWLGYIAVTAKPASYFIEEKLYLYQTLAEQGAVALRAARLRTAVRESQQRFQGLVETLSDWIWEVDQNGAYTYVSPKVQDLLGYEPQEVLGKTPFDLMPPEEARRVAGVLEPLMAAQQPLVTIENANRHKDGHLVVFETSGVPFFDAEGRFKGYRGTDRDITERQRAEAELVAARQVEQKFSEQLATLVAVTNELSKTQTLDELCRSAIEVGRTRLGFDRLGLWFVTEDHSTMLGTYGTGADGQTTDERHVRHPVVQTSRLLPVIEGSIALRRYKDAPLYDTEGKLIGMGERIAIGLWDGETVTGFLSVDNFINRRPFTDRDCELLRLYTSTLGHLCTLKRAQENLTRLAKTMEQHVIERTAQLQAALKETETFSYSVSHDLRAPLRAINGFSHILMEEYAPELPAEATRYLETICESARQMGYLVDGLLTFSRLGRLPLHLQRIDTVDLVRRALESQSSEQEGRRIEIVMGELPACMGDQALLRQVWVNLLSNAFKFTRERNVARIEIGFLTQEDGAPIYFVKDNGVGFDMQYAGKLFGVFQRLHSAEEYEGTGVGLAIVQRIVHRHGGRVWAEAALGAGATFCFTLK